MRKNFYKKPTFFDHLAIFILKVGSPRSQYSCGFPGFVATFPLFFFNLLLLKNNNIIYNWQIKVGFWPQQYLVKNFANITKTLMRRINYKLYWGRIDDQVCEVYENYTRYKGIKPNIEYIDRMGWIDSQVYERANYSEI